MQVEADLNSDSKKDKEPRNKMNCVVSLKKSAIIGNKCFFNRKGVLIHGINFNFNSKTDNVLHCMPPRNEARIYQKPR